MQPGPADIAFQQHYTDLLRVLQRWILPVTSSCHAKGLISDDITQTIKCSEAMPSDERVSRLLNAVQTSICDEQETLCLFVKVLKEQGASLELIGEKLDKTYRKCGHTNCNGKC